MDSEYICNAGSVKAVTLSECSNTPVTPYGISGPFVGKIPVVLAEPVVQIVVEANIDLKEPVLEIKRIKKNLFINQCKLIDLGNGVTGKLFLAGFVRKNIEFATICDINEKFDAINGDIKHSTFKIPFQCATEVRYVVPPQITFSDRTKELSFFIDNCDEKECGKEINIGRFPCEQSFEHSELFNEKVFCELEEVKIFEDDIHDGSKPLDCKLPSERTFDKITEKMVILIRVKLLQKQQVNIPGRGHDMEVKGKGHY